MSATLTVSDERIDRWQPPPAPRTPAQFAVTIRLPDGPQAGELWQPDSEPVQRIWVEQMANPHWQIMSAVASSQRGKSLMGVALPVLHTVVEARAAVAYVMPSLEKLTQAWTGKLQPLLRGCGYGDWLRAVGPGARGGKPAVLPFYDPLTKTLAGMVYFLAGGGGGKETSTAAITSGVVVVDEADDFASAAHLGLVARRTRSFGERFRIYILSTVNERKGRDAHPILIVYAQGTRSRLFYPCPACGHYQALVWEQVKYDDLDCGYQCAHCPVIWTEAQRHQALNRAVLVHEGQGVDASGLVVGAAPPTRNFSLLAWDLEFHRASLKAIVAEYRVAETAIRDRSDHGPMRQFYHKVLCRDYTADIDEMEHGADLTWQSLLDRSAMCEWGVAIHATDRDEANDGHRTFSRHHCDPPPAAVGVSVGIDVQQNRLYWAALAFSMDMTTWAIGWGTEYARLDQRPWNRAELFTTLERIAALLPTLAPDLDLVFAGIDVGDFTAELQAWLSGQKKPWRAVKGVPSFKPTQGDLPGIVAVREGELLIESDNTRQLVHQALRRPNGSVGALHLPRGLANTATDRTYPQHLTGEREIIDPKTRKPKLVHAGRWDLLDGTRYAYAGMRLHIARATRPPSGRRYGLITKIGR